MPNKASDAVKLIYTLFLEGKTVEEIIRTLTDIGIKTRNGTPLSRYNIMYILGNETYKGDKLLQKQAPRNFITKKPDPTIPFESNYLENDHEAIVSRDVWDAVQKKLEENKKIDIKTYQVLASKEYGLYQEVHLRFNFMTTIEGLYYFLERLRNFETAILIQEINIQKVQRRTGPDLVINVILAALMEKGEKS